MTSEEFIKIKNLEYANLLEREVHNFEIITSNYSEFELQKEIMKLATQTQLLILPSKYGNLHSFEYKLVGIINTIKDFWKENKELYSKSVRQLNGLNVFIREREVSKINTLSTYFDTSVYSDESVNFFYTDKSFRAEIVGCIIYLRYLYQLVPFLKSDSDRPIVALFPYQLQGGSFNQRHLDNASGKVIDPVWITAEQNTLDFLAKYCKGNGKRDYIMKWYDDINEVPDFMEFNINLNHFFYLDEIREFIHYDENQLNNSQRLHDEFKKYLPNDFKNSDILQVFAGESCIVDKHGYMDFIKLIHQKFLDSAYDDIVCNETLSDPFITNEKEFIIKSQIENQRFCKYGNITEEMVASYTINSPEFSWLNPITKDDALRFRESGGIEFLRNVFRKHRKLIKYATIEDFQKIALTINESLIYELKEYENIYKHEKLRLGRKYRLTTLNFAFTGAITLLSNIFPQINFIELPSTIWSMLAGANIKDVINQYVSGKKDLNIINRRPIGILLKYYQNKP